MSDDDRGDDCVDIIIIIMIAREGGEGGMKGGTGREGGMERSRDEGEGGDRSLILTR